MSGVMVLHLRDVEPVGEMRAEGLRILMPAEAPAVLAFGPDGFIIVPVLSLEDDEVPTEECAMALDATVLAAAERSATLLQIARAAGCRCTDVHHVHGPLDTKGATTH